MSTQSSSGVDSGNYDQLDRLADEFAERFRRGERPSVKEYIDRYPHLADEILSLFPAMADLEQADEVRQEPVVEKTSAPTETPELWQLGDYRILREIGRGGMGVVYEAEQVSLGRRVALKILPQHVARDARMLERFRREARAAARLHHTNIVPVFEVGRQGETCYYAMQFIQGQGLDLVYDALRQLRGRAEKPSNGAPIAGLAELTLAATDSQLGTALYQVGPALGQVVHSLLTGQFEADGTEALDRENGSGTGALANHGSRSPSLHSLHASASSSAVLPGGSQLSTVDSRRAQYARSIARIGHQVAEGLAYAHERGVIHRDIKPSNLLLDTAGVTWITDFGLAKADDDALTQTGDILGTIRYMAPERFRGESDERADIYALGLTLYELLTLSPAFDSSDRLRLIEQVKSEEPIRPRQLDRRIPRDLETVILKTIDKDPKGRYPTAREMAEDLRRFLDDESILARRVAPGERAWRWCRRNPWIAGSLITTVAALVAVAVISTTYGLEQARSKDSISRLAHSLDTESKNLRKERTTLQTTLGESSRRMAMLHYERGQTACEQGDVGTGLLYFVASWRAAVDAGDLNAQQMARMSLAAWRSHYPGLKALITPATNVLRIICGPDGKVLTSGTTENTAQIIDVVSGQPSGPPLEHHSPIFHGLFDPEGQTVITVTSDRVVRLWEVASGKPVGPGFKIGSHYPAFVDQGAGWKVLAIGADPTTALIWDAVTGQPLGHPFRHESAILAVACSADGKTVLTGGQDGKTRFWEAASGKPVGNTIDSGYPIYHLVLSPDRKTLLVSGAFNDAQLWDASSGKPLGAALPHPHGFRAGAFSRDRRTLATGGYEEFSARLWDITTAKPIGLSLPHRDELDSIAFSRDGKSILTSSADKTARLWGFDPGEAVGMPLQYMPNQFIANASYTPDGKGILATFYDRPARLWDSMTGKPLSGELAAPVSSSRRRIELSRDGKSMLHLDLDGGLQLFERTTGREVGPVLRHPDGKEITTVAFSRDGKTVLTGSPDKTARMWEISTGKSVGPLFHHGRDITCVAFSPDGKSVVTGGGNVAIQWDIRTGNRVAAVFTHRNTVWCLAYSPDGKKLLTGALDNTARIWDIETGQPEGAVMQHRSGVYCVAFSPDAKTVLTGGAEGMAQLWDARTAKPIGPPIRHLSSVWRVAFRPDSKAFFTLAESLRIWQVPDLVDDVDRAAVWVEVVSGMELDDQGNARLLDSTNWHRKRGILDSLGGTPEKHTEPMRDPILYGPDPLVRARALIDRKLWGQAEIALDEIVAAWPFVASFWLERGRFHLDRGFPEKAAVDFAKALSLGDGIEQRLAEMTSSQAALDHLITLLPEKRAQLWLARAAGLARAGDKSQARVALELAGDLQTDRSQFAYLLVKRAEVHAILAAWNDSAADYDRAVRNGLDAPVFRYQLAIARLLSGDLTGYRAACAEAFMKFGAARDPSAANRLAYAAIYGHDAVHDMEAVVQAAVQSVKLQPGVGGERIVGAALYRAGRYDAALEQFQKSHQQFQPRAWDWLFLAMIQSRLGQSDEARQMLARAQRWIAAADTKPPGQGPDVWNNPLTEPFLISRLRSEAEALVLFDPIFPANPFAH